MVALAAMLVMPAVRVAINVALGAVVARFAPGKVVEDMAFTDNGPLTTKIAPRVRITNALRPHEQCYARNLLQPTLWSSVRCSTCHLEERVWLWCASDWHIAHAAMGLAARIALCFVREVVDSHRA